MANPISIAQGIFSKAGPKYYSLLLYLQALAEYWMSPMGWRGGHNARMHLLRFNSKLHDHQKPSRIAIFVGFSNKLTLSNKSYLESLACANYCIFYVSNCQLTNEAKEALASLAWKVTERYNLGRDIGAYRDAVLWLRDQGFLQFCEILIIANDSMQFLPGKYGGSLVDSLRRFEDSSNVALFSHISYMHALHFQSFFQVLKKSVFNSREFQRFWEKYIPLSHRGHCIFNGEIGISKSVYNKLTEIEVLYTSSRLQASLEKNYSNNLAPSANDLMRLMPSPTRTRKRKKRNHILESLADAANPGEALPYHKLYLLSEIIENSNSSHVCAFLFPLFLQCPLVKKDICLAGSFSIAQAALLLREALESSMRENSPAVDIEEYLEEYSTALSLNGTPLSHASMPRMAALKGVTSGFVYSDIYDR
jgi:hypothetical protein